MQSYYSYAASDPTTATPDEATDLQTNHGHKRRGQSARPEPVARPLLPTPHTWASVPAPPGDERKNNHSSSTWTASSGDPELLKETEQFQDRSMFIQEYNRLAGKVRTDPSEYVADDTVGSLVNRRNSTGSAFSFLTTITRPW